MGRFALVLCYHGPTLTKLNTMPRDRKPVPSLKMPSQGRSRERVTRILQAAASLLSDAEPGDISIRQIAKTAEVSLGTIYQFFVDKEAIFQSLVDAFEAALFDRLDAELSVTMAEQDIGDYVTKLMLAIDSTQVEHSGFVCIFRINSTAEMNHFAQQVRQRLMRFLDKQIGKAYPQLLAPQRRLTLNVFESALMAVMAELPARGHRNRRAYIATATDLLVPYLRMRFKA